jgi:hypothetical protein
MSATKTVAILGPDPGNNETLAGSLIYKVIGASNTLELYLMLSSVG